MHLFILVLYTKNGTDNTQTNHSGEVVRTAETKTTKWGKCIGGTVLVSSGGKEVFLVQRKGKRGALAAALQPFVKNCRSSESGFIMHLSMHDKVPEYLVAGHRRRLEPWTECQHPSSVKG